MCECVFVYTAHHIYMKINIGNRIDFQEYVHFNKIIYPEFFSAMNGKATTTPTAVATANRAKNQ